MHAVIAGAYRFCWLEYTRVYNAMQDTARQWYDWQSTTQHASNQLASSSSAMQERRDMEEVAVDVADKEQVQGKSAGAKRRKDKQHQ